MSGSVRQTFIVTVDTNQYLTERLVEEAIGAGIEQAKIDWSMIKATWVSDREEPK